LKTKFKKFENKYVNKLKQNKPLKLVQITTRMIKNKELKLGQEFSDYEIQIA